MTERSFTSTFPAPPVDRSPVVAALRHALAEPNRTAIVDGATGERLSRAELARRSASVAAYLAGRRIGRGDRVAVALPTGAHWAVVALGVWRAGAVLVPLNVRWTPEETARALALVRPALTITSEPPPAPAGDAFAPPDVKPGHLAVVPFSSGTGGLPKGVRLSHGNLSAAAAALARAYASAGTFGPGDTALAGAPFFHMMGLGAGLGAPLSAGARIVTLPVADSGRALELIAEHRVTHAILPAPIVEELASVRRREPHALRLVATAGAPVTAAAQVGAGERLGCLVRQGYGMTEASPISVPAGASDPATAGWLAPGIEARLVDVEHEAGELWIRGPQVSDGYYADAEATAATITAGGWLRTGDLVTVRDDGQVVIVDRLKELIKVDGASVAPAELELVLREHPAVRDAAVVGRPDAAHGEVPVAHVVLAADASAAELALYTNRRVAAHKALRDVRVVGELPRAPSGKLLRRTLRDRELRT